MTLESFWFIDFQSLCHIAHKPEHKYFPCEIGIVQYSLNDGIINEYHKFIKPGKYLVRGHSLVTGHRQVNIIFLEYTSLEEVTGHL